MSKKGKRKLPKDTGIVRLPGGFPIKEELRDALQKPISAADTSGHVESSTFNADGLSTKELEDKQWSGLRHNFLIGKLELWVGGQIKKELFLEDVRKNPGLIATVFEEVFGLKAHVIQTDVPYQGTQGFKNIH